MDNLSFEISSSRKLYRFHCMFYHKLLQYNFSNPYPDIYDHSNNVGQTILNIQYIEYSRKTMKRTYLTKFILISTNLKPNSCTIYPTVCNHAWNLQKSSREMFQVRLQAYKLEFKENVTLSIDIKYIFQTHNAPIHNTRGLRVKPILCLHLSCSVHRELDCMPFSSNPLLSPLQ